ncbi:uncharacterized protein LOC129749691 [Uranotaenia lowii]|uniref:uncharacterized protein LOC129749691 n=1 Tax=Uranotaenia lowii TaxID=190385 RepID=UPI00247AF263|nr:uncharacterized protein LOC129749691 [Uranotaenia lowii]
MYTSRQEQTELYRVSAQRTPKSEQHFPHPDLCFPKRLDQLSLHHEAICHSTDLADPKLRSLYVSGNIKYQFRKSFFALSFYNLINAQLDWNKHPKMFNSSLEEQFSRNQSIPDMHLMMAASIELEHNLPTNCTSQYTK